MPRTYFVSALGCKVNQYDGQHVREVLEDLGLAPAAEGQHADVVVVQTCAVTATACRKSRHVVRHVAHAPGTRVIVTGCGATDQPDHFAQIPGVIAVIARRDDLRSRLTQILAGTQNLSQSVSISSPQGNLNEASSDDSVRPDEPEDRATSPDHASPAPSAQHPIRTKGSLPRQVKWTLDQTVGRLAGHQRAFLKVQDGCDAGCTYCVVPRLRPDLVSKPPEMAVREASTLVAAGHKEIVVTGVCLGAYGRSTARKSRLEEGPSPLADLIDALTRVPGLKRLRLSSLEPLDVTEELLTVLARREACAPHLHLPLQSGSDDVLRRMNRQYRSTDYLETIRRVRSALDRPAITTDIIVGFPGETDEAFEQTMALAGQVGFARIHMFPYSPRSGTAACRWQREQPPREVLIDRMNRLRTLADETALAFRRSFVGQTHTILIESREGELWSGRTSRYFPVGFAPPSDAGAEDLRGRLARVVIEQVAADGVRGRLEAMVTPSGRRLDGA